MLIASSINTNLWSRSLSFVARSRSIDLLSKVGWSPAIFHASVLIGIFFLSLFHLDWWSPIIRDSWSLRLLLLLLWHHPGLYSRRLICTPPIPFIVWGISFEHNSFTYCLGFLAPILLESFVHYFHVIRPPITWGVLAPILLECLVCSSRTIYPLLLREFLDLILLESLVCNLRTIRPLSFGEFLLLLYFRETCFLCTPFICHFLLGPSAHFSFGVFFVC